MGVANIVRAAVLHLDVSKIEIPVLAHGDSVIFCDMLDLWRGRREWK